MATLDLDYTARLQRIMHEYAGNSSNKLAKLIDIPQTTMHYISAGRIPKSDNLAKIGFHFKIDGNWLLYGIGEMGGLQEGEEPRKIVTPEEKIEINDSTVKELIESYKNQIKTLRDHLATKDELLKVYEKQLGY